jgi:hypothetical protein
MRRHSHAALQRLQSKQSECSEQAKRGGNRYRDRADSEEENSLHRSLATSAAPALRTVMLVQYRTIKLGTQCTAELWALDMGDF